MQVPEGFVARTGHGVTAWVRADLAGLPLARWWEAGAPLPHASGRGRVCVLEVGGVRAVARDYRRGGVLGGILRERFLDAGRAARELTVLARLRARGVPVVEPLAAVAERRFPFVRLRLATVLVAGAVPLPAFLAAEPARRREAIRAAGACVRAALDAGLEHPDLHPENLVARVDGGRVEVRLLDLDRARLVTGLGAAAREAMLVRFGRFLARHHARLPPVSRVDRLRFLAGYGFDRAARAECVPRLRRALERQIARHRWAWAKAAAE